MPFTVWHAQGTEISTYTWTSSQTVAHLYISHLDLSIIFNENCPHFFLLLSYLILALSLFFRSPPIPGFLDDYAFIICGLLDLYEATLQMEWLKWAEELQLRQDNMFWDDEGGGYFCSDPSDTTVLLQLKEGDTFILTHITSLDHEKKQASLKPILSVQVSQASKFSVFQNRTDCWHIV